MRRGLLYAARFTRSIHDAPLERLLTPLRHPNEPNAVRRNYLPLIDELRTNPPKEPPLTRQQLMTIVDMLAVSGRPGDLDCIRAMCAHLPAHFGLEVTPEFHTVVIKGLLRQGYVPLAQTWLRNMADLPPHNPPTVEHYHTFLRHCPNHIQPPFLREIVAARMRYSGVKPNDETFLILVRCIINNSDHLKLLLDTEIFHGIIADMKANGVAPATQIRTLISDYYTGHGFSTLAEEVQTTFDAHFPEDSDLAYRAFIQRLKRTKNPLVAVRRLLHRGTVKPTPEVLRAILRTAKSVDEIRRVEDVLHVQADVTSYALLVNNCIRSGEVKQALAIYETTKSIGLVPVAGLVAPIIRSLCSDEDKSTVRFNAHLDIALNLYADLAEAYPVPEDGLSDPAASGPHAHANGPDVPIYNSLLRGLCFSSNTTTAYPLAHDLLDDMKARGIEPTSSTTTSKLILEMRNCNTLESAYSVYAKARHELTDVGYYAVLHAFSRMSHLMGHPDLLDTYFRMVADMRQAGFRMNARVYTDLLQQFAELATMRRAKWRQKNLADLLRPLPPGMFADLEEGVRKIHNICTVEWGMAPQTYLWNQLMDTYQRMGNFAEAFRVWQTLYHAGSYGSHSVSIILDACGYAGEFSIAHRIVSSLMAEQYIMTLHNWKSYVEALCRMNQFSRALETVTETMGSVSQPVKADASMIEIMLKFAPTRIQRNVIEVRIKRHLPDLYGEWMVSRGRTSPPEPERPP